MNESNVLKLKIFNIKKITNVIEKYNNIIFKPCLIVSDKFSDRKFMFYRSQNLKEEYHYDAGHCYWYNLNEYNKIRNRKKIKTLSIILNNYEVKDINTIEEFRLAERLFKFNKLKR